MDATPQVQLSIVDNEQRKPSSDETNFTKEQQRKIQTKKNIWRWVRITTYTILVVLGQAIATLLGRLYFTKGGNSKWLGTTVQLIGFPILFPFYFMLPTKQLSVEDGDEKPPSRTLMASIYTVLGVFAAGDTLLYTVGIQYLPATTFSLLSASQLGFNAVTSFFLNRQKFTPYIVNSLVLLTISSTLLVFQKNDDSSDDDVAVSGAKYALGFISTTVASAGYALSLSLGQVVFTRVLKGKVDFKCILDMVLYESLVASFATIVGLFASGEWRTLPHEMNTYELGKVSYIMTLVWTAVLWELFSIGAVGLIYEVSSLFSNVIDTLGLPLTPVLAVIFLHDKMDGIKGISMVLAIWGFVSYGYQQYLDEYGRGDNDKKNGNDDGSEGATKNECP